MAGPSGPIMHPPGQYTHCVDRKDYRDVPGFLDAGFAEIGEFALCEYLLGGKLVCLAGGDDVCAIGFVVGIEEVGYEKSGFAEIDNDFSFNMVPLPYQARDFQAFLSSTFRPEPHVVRDKVVANNPVFGPLLVDPSPSPTLLPAPKEPSQFSPVDGYGVLYRFDETGAIYHHQHQDNLHKLWTEYPPHPDNSAVAIPIIHCECEGSRIFFVCQALKPFLEIMQLKPPGSGAPAAGQICRAVLGWIPFGIGKAICAIIHHLIAAAIALALAPAMAAALAAAWAAAQAYDDLAVTGPIAKQISIGEPYIVIGRWTWDAGHAGHTELHPVKAIQHVQLPFELSGGYDPTKRLSPQIEQTVRDFSDRWCRHLSAAPPPPDLRFPDLPGLSEPQLRSLNPEQRTNHDRQQRPENSWQLHPLIDGCLGEG